MIGILHAYSRHNAGDSLLVDLTLERLRRCGIEPDDVLLVALDPETFGDAVPHRVGIGVPGRGVDRHLLWAAGRSVSLAASALARRPVGGLARALRGCDALLAVGGGYLRAVDHVSSAGTSLNHLPQLVWAARQCIPTLYLPQSIGPLRGPAGAAVRRALRGIDTVCVRDPWSERDLAALSNARRVPDLAVLDLAEGAGVPPGTPSAGRVAFVARQVRHAPGYEGAVVAVARALGDRAVWAVQAEGDATKSDGVHYQGIGVEGSGRLADVLGRGDVSVVVSVRLHGALMALGAGVPAVHLAYDRKGPAAFADLGLDEWCLDVRTVDRDRLAAAVDTLAADPGPYWQQLRDRAAGLQQASRALDDLIRAAVRP